MCGRRGSGRARQEQSSSGILTASLGVAPASRPAPSGPRYSPVGDAGPGSLRRGQNDAGTPGSGCRGDRGDRCAAEMRARRRRRCSARPRSDTRGRPMGAGRAPLRAASGAGPEERVGNRDPIGPPNDRSASGRPISNGGYRSGAFGVGLETDNRSTLGTRLHPGPRARPEGCGTARPGAAFPRGSGGAARESPGPAEEARLEGDGDGAPNKAALGGPSGLRLLPQ